MLINDDRIVKISDWVQLDQIPSQHDDLNDEHGKIGVYQVVENVHKELVSKSLIHKDIVYTGQSGKIHKRTYDMRMKNGNHPVAMKFRNDSSLKKKDYSVRIIYLEKSEVAFENEIHKKTEEEFGQKYKWIDASFGKDGIVMQIADKLERCNSSELIDIIKISKGLFLERSMEEAETLLSREIS